MEIFGIVLITIICIIGSSFIILCIVGFCSSLKKLFENKALEKREKEIECCEAYSFKIIVLKQLNSQIGFGEVTYSKDYSQNVSQKKYLYTILKKTEIEDFLKEEAEKKLRIDFIYKHYYEKLVKGIDEKCNTPIEEIKKSGISYLKFIELEKKAFQNRIVHFKLSPTLVHRTSKYTTPAGRKTYTISDTFSDATALEENCFEEVEFNFKIDKKYVNDSYKDYETLSKFESYQIFKFNGMYFRVLNGKNTFVSNDGVKEVYLTKKLIRGDSVLEGEAIDLVKSNTRKKIETFFIEAESSYSIITAESFKNCDSLKEITLNDNIVDIPRECFFGCKNLYSVKLSKNTKSIGDKAFANCPNLNEIFLPNTIQSISNNAFNNKNLCFFSSEPLMLCNLRLEYGVDGFYIYKLH